MGIAAKIVALEKQLELTIVEILLVQTHSILQLTATHGIKAVVQVYNSLFQLIFSYKSVVKV